MPDFTPLLADPRALHLRQVFVPHSKLFLVGGSVRDFLIGKEVKDIDLACPLSSQQVLEILKASNIRCIETGAKHGTVTAVIDQSNIEITSFRGKSIANQELEEALVSDLRLRDFSVNALAISLDDGQFFDPTGGLSDLRDKIIKAPAAAADRFLEDPLRIMRMIRFGPAMGFTVEEATYSAAKQLCEKLQQVSIERIQREFSGIICSLYPRAALSMMLDLGTMEMFFPEALPSVGFEQNDFHNETVFEHTLSVVENTPAQLRLRLAAFFHDLGKPHTLSIDEQGSRHFYEHEQKSTEITKEVMHRLRYSNDLTDSVAAIVRYHMRPIDCGPSGVRRLLRDLGPEFEAWRKFKEADHPPVFTLDQTLVELNAFDLRVKTELERAELELLKKLVVSGHDLMQLGFKAGPVLGKVIKHLEEEVIEDPSRNSREYLIARAKELLTDSEA